MNQMKNQNEAKAVFLRVQVLALGAKGSLPQNHFPLKSPFFSDRVQHFLPEFGYEKCLHWIQLLSDYCGHTLNFSAILSPFLIIKI